MMDAGIVMIVIIGIAGEYKYLLVYMLCMSVPGNCMHDSGTGDQINGGVVCFISLQS